MFYSSLFIITSVSIIIYFDYFGFDYGYTINYNKDIYNQFFYFTVVMIIDLFDRFTYR